MARSYDRRKWGAKSSDGSKYSSLYKVYLLTLNAGS